MLSRQMIGLYSMLSTGEYLTAEVLAQMLHVSSKTVRNQIKCLNETLEEYAAHVESKHGTGYRLVANDPDRIRQLEQLLWNQEIQKTRIPDSSEERVRYVMDYLLGADDYIKLDCLSELLYVSKKTLTCNLKEVEATLNEYHLSLERKPNYGIRIIGKEYNRRLCIAGSELRRSLILDQTRDEAEQPEEIVWIRQCLQDGMAAFGLSISNVACKNLILHILIAIRRMQTGHYIETENHGLRASRDPVVRKTARRIVERISEKFDVEVRESEIIYLSVHLEGKRTLMGEAETEIRNEISWIDPDIPELMEYMLNAVNDAFRFDFRDDEELKKAMGQHLVPMVVRLQHNMKLTNPLLREIKERYSLAYTMAATACLFLSHRYHAIVKEDEIAYIALIFALGLERKKSRIRKKNILLVCTAGKGGEELMLYRYRSEFNAYINELRAIDINQIEEQDFSGIDFVFSTSPVSKDVPVPVIEVRHFLRNADILTIKRILRGQKDGSVTEVYREELFLPHMRFESKKEALKVLCDYALEHGYAKEGLHDSVKAREAIENTAYENGVAMPHPITVANERPFALVALLDTPLKWAEDDSGKTVQAIFLISAANNPYYDVQRFYQVTARLMLDAYSMKELVRNQKFQTLKSMLLEAEQEVEEEDL